MTLKGRLTEQQLQRILDARGYWVIWSVVQWEIGSAVWPHDVLTDQRFVVVAETDKADFDEQLRMLSEAPTPAFDNALNFYRVLTD